MSMVNISIIIPHYNSPNQLRTLLASIGKRENVQVIVVDDRSTKELTEYQKCVEEFSSENIVFLTNDREAKGAGAARNVGLKTAAGKWLLFADSDDYFVDGWYETVMKYMDSADDIVYFVPTDYNLATKTVDGRSKLYRHLCEDFLNNEKDAGFNIRIGFCVPWSKLIRTSLVKENDICFEEVMYSNDVMFSTMTGNMAKSVTVGTGTIYCVTRGEGSLTRNETEQAFRIRTQVFIEQYKYIRDNMKPDYYCIESIRRLVKVIKRKYGFKVLKSYYKLFRDNDVPVFSYKTVGIVLKKVMKGITR